MHGHIGEARKRWSRFSARGGVAAAAFLVAAVALLVAALAVPVVWQLNTRLAVEIAAIAFVAVVVSTITATVLVRANEREAVALEEQLDAARDRGFAKDRYLAALGTELRAPLSGIYGFTDHFATTGFGNQPETMEVLGMLSRDAADLTRRVENLSVAALIESGAYRPLLEPVSLSEELRVELLPIPETDLTVGHLSHEVVVEADRLAVRQILSNIVGNARAHGGDQLKVEIEVREHTAIVTVADDGGGLPADAVTGVMDATNPRLIGSATGLGLPVSVALAHAVGGSLDYVRAFGWTNVVIAFPLAADHSIGGPRTADEADAADLPVLTVVIDEKTETAQTESPAPSATIDGPGV